MTPSHARGLCEPSSPTRLLPPSHPQAVEAMLLIDVAPRFLPPSGVGDSGARNVGWFLLVLLPDM